MTMTTKPYAALSLAALLLAGCSSMNVFKDDTSTPPANDLPPEEPAMRAAAPSSGSMSSAEISKALSGKSWKWTAKNFSGVTLFANDGSSLIEIKGKDSSNPVTTTGRWRATDGQLCESVRAAPPVLQSDVAETCKPISGGGSRYQVGSATFELDN